MNLQRFAKVIGCLPIAAAALGADTRFTSLQLGCPDPVANGHGPGLSLAWDQRGKPMAGIDHPVLAYHRLFSDETMPLAANMCMAVHPGFFKPTNFVFICDNFLIRMDGSVEHLHKSEQKIWEL